MKKLIVGGVAAAALAGGIALSAPANATAYYDTDGTYGGGYMGDYDGSAYANMFGVVGVSYSSSDAGRDPCVRSCYGVRSTSTAR